MTCIFSNNAVCHTYVLQYTIKSVYTYKLCQVNCHSFRSRMLPLQNTHVLIDIKLPPLVSCAPVFFSIFTQHEDTPPVPFNYYGYFFTRVKQTQLIIGMKLEHKKKRN